MHLQHLLHNILFLIYLLFLNCLLPYQLFLVFLLLSINLLMKKYLFRFHLIQVALIDLDCFFLLRKGYMTIYSFVHNHLNLHFFHIRNHLRNIFLNMQNILLHVQTFLLLSLLVYFPCILFVLCLLLLPL